MAKLVFGMSQSLDGYVDDEAGTLCMPAPGPAVFEHFLDVVAGHAGALYGRRIYEVMRYWDVDRPEWDALASATIDLSSGSARSRRRSRYVLSPPDERGLAANVRPVLPSRVLVDLDESSVGR